MEYSFEFHEQYVRITLAGKADYEGLYGYIHELVEHPQWKPGSRVLTDFQNIDISEFTGEYAIPRLKVYAGILQDHQDKLGVVTNAALIASGELQALNKIMCNLMDMINIQMVNENFIDEQKALQWLLDQPMSE